MLEQIVLNNFLLFDKNQHFDLKRINLLTGLNNTGKTDFLKSILLIRQSLPSLFKNNELTINSKKIKFGKFNDISNGKELLIKVKYDGLVNTFKSFSTKNSIEEQKWEKVKIDRIHYYQNIPRISDSQITKLVNILRQMNFDYNNWNSAMGLILGYLRAKPNDVVISEHPGEKFHPYCQSELINILFAEKKENVQWFIETHISTILNAFRILVKKQHIDSNDLNILHFSHNASPKTIKVEPDGRIEDWPEYFFDQDDKDYKELFGL